MIIKFLASTATDISTTTDMPNEVIIDVITAGESITTTEVVPTFMVTKPKRSSITTKKPFTVPQLNFSTNKEDGKNTQNVALNKKTTKSVSQYKSKSFHTSIVFQTSTRRSKDITSFRVTFKTPTVSTKKPTIKLTTATAKPKITKRVTFPKIYIKTPPSTPKIIRKIVPYTFKPTSKNTKKMYPVYNPHFSNKESEYNDFIEVTIPKDNDETLLITSPFPDQDYSKEFWSEEIENAIDVSVVKNFSETLKLLTQEGHEIGNNNIMAIVVSSIGTVIFVIIIIVFILRHYRYSYPRRTLFSSGVSQSDVRFFPNDENLDFTLDNDFYGKT